MVRVSRHPGRSEIRRRVVDAARKHFFMHGFRGVSMDDLVAELGMSKKTLYALFASKHELVRAAMLAKFAELDAELRQITSDRGLDSRERLRRLLECLQRHSGEIQPAFVRDIRRDAPDLFDIVQTRRSALIERYFGKLLEEGQRAGALRRDIPVVIVIEVLLAATQAIANPQKLAELHMTPQDAYTAIIRTVFEGVTSRRHGS